MAEVVHDRRPPPPFWILSKSYGALFWILGSTSHQTSSKMSAKKHWALAPDAVATSLEVDATTGLSSNEVMARLVQYGPNSIPEEPATPWWKLVAAQFDDLLVKMLLGAAAVSFCLALTEEAGPSRNHAMVEPLVILTILVLNAVSHMHWTT